MATTDFFFDIGSPYTYLAFQRLPSLAAGAAVLAALLRLGAYPQIQPGAERSRTPERARQTRAGP
jgi:2-hydroxychromene-2-carboxylate isomerase